VLAASDLNEQTRNPDVLESGDEIEKWSKTTTAVRDLEATR
jgi:hypothetical protein